MNRFGVILFIACVFLFLGCDQEEEKKDDPKDVKEDTFLSVEVEALTPGERQVQADLPEVLVARFEFTARVDSVVIKKLRLYQIEAGGDDAVEVIKLRANSVLSADGIFVGGYVAWDNLSIDVPGGGSVVVEVLVSFFNSDVVADVAGKKVRFGIRNLEDDWVDGNQPSAPNGVLNGSGEMGDLKAVSQKSGKMLKNYLLSSKDQIAGDKPFGSNLDDSVGVVSFGANTLTKTQYLTNSLVALTLAANNPSGYRGWASGADRDIFRFEISASLNMNAASPQEAFIDRFTITLEGGAEADQFELYGPSDPVNPIATSVVVHRTTVLGGNPSIYTDHVSVKTTVLFVLTGFDRFIPYGTRKMYRVRARVYALTDVVNCPRRSLTVSIAGYGDAQTAGDVRWAENGDPNTFTVSKIWDWIYSHLGNNSLIPSQSLEYEGDTYIS